MDKNTLLQVGEWAQSRVASGEEPPWTFHKLKLFAEIANDLASGMEAVATLNDVSTDMSVPHNSNGERTDTNAKIIRMDNFRATRAKDELVLPT